MVPKVAATYIKWLHRWSGTDWGNKENGSTLWAALEFKWHTTFGLTICSVLVKVGGASGSIQMDSWSKLPMKGASRCSTASLRGTRPLKPTNSQIIDLVLLNPRQTFFVSSTNNLFIYEAPRKWYSIGNNHSNGFTNEILLIISF